MENRDKIKLYLLDIMEQSTRHKRASNLKRFLVTDLEIIEDRVNKVRKLLNTSDTFSTEK